MSMWLDNLKFYYGEWTTANDLSFDVNFDDLFTDFDSGRWINFGSRKDDVKTIDQDFSLTFGFKGDDILIVEGNHNYIDGGRDHDMVVAIGDHNFVNGGSGSDLLGAFGHGNILSPGHGNDFVVVGGTDNYMIASPGDDLFDLKGDPTATAVFSGKLSKYSFEEISLGVYTSTDLRSFFGFDFDGHDTFITDLGVDAGLKVKFLDGTLANVKDLVPNNIPRTVDDTHTQDVDPVKKTQYNPDGTVDRENAGTKEAEKAATSNDSDFDADALTPTKITETASGNTSGTTAEGDLAEVTIRPDGTYEVTAKESLFALREGATATETYSYQVSDGNGGFNEALITIEFTGANSDPFAATDEESVDENGSVDVMPIANDTDPNVGDTLSLHAINDIFVDGMKLMSIPYGLYAVVGNTFTFNALGSLFDHLNVGDASLVAVNYQVADDFVATNDGVMNITVNGVNDDPVANDIAKNGTEDVLPSADALAVASDVDDGAVLSFGGFTGGDTGDVSEAGGIISVVGDFQHLGDGDSTNVVVTYLIMDEHGAFSNEATVTFIIGGLNDAPVANDTSATGTEDALPSVDVLAEPGAASDVDDGHVLSFGAITGLTVDGFGVFNPNAFVSESGGVLSVVGDYQHLDDGESTEIVVSYSIQDEHGASDSAKATFTVNGLNDAPNKVAGASVADQTATAGDAFNLNLTLGDLFEDVDGEALTVGASGLPAWLTYNQDAGTDTMFGTADDVLTFTGTAGNNGGTISLIASDGDADSDAFMFDLTVNPADGGGGGDLPDGGGSSDLPDGGGGSDLPDGGGGSDLPDGGGGSDLPDGGGDSDLPDGGGDSDLPDGGGGSDLPDGGGDSDLPDGGGGSDLPDGGGGSDLPDGGGGDTELPPVDDSDPSSGSITAQNDISSESTTFALAEEGMINM